MDMERSRLYKILALEEVEETSPEKKAEHLEEMMELHLQILKVERIPEKKVER
jgi:hypothetical protein